MPESHPNRRRRASRPALLAVSVLATLAVACSDPAAAHAQVAWGSCPDSTVTLRCGTLSVLEDRARPTARRIEIAFAISPATGASRADDPVVVLLGGPGDAAMRRVAGLARSHAALNATRDVIFVDQRGTGMSSPLVCMSGSDDDLQSYMAAFLPLDAMAGCLASLRERADLGRYRTADFVTDLEELRRALGVRQWNLHGVSYGTRVALQYMARHPSSIRAAILVAVVPPELTMPATFGEDTDRALDLLAADCRADAACAAAFPNFRAEADSVARRLERAPAVTSVPHPVTGVSQQVTLSRGTFGEVMRATMYTPAGARRLPLEIHEAYRGDHSALATSAMRRQRSIARDGWMGLYLAVTCLEDVARADTADVYRRSRNTILGEARARNHIGGCVDWPANPDGKEWPASHRFSTPVLMIVGDQDPATPPRHAEAAMRHASNGKLVVVPQGAHGFPGMTNLECLSRMQAAFVSSADPKQVDAACVATMKRLPFVTSR